MKFKFFSEANQIFQMALTFGVIFIILLFFPLNGHAEEVKFIDKINHETRYKNLVTEIFNLPKKSSTTKHKTIDDPCSKLECVPIHLCINGSIATEGNDLLDWKISRRISIINYYRQECNESEELCCLDDDGFIEEDENDERNRYDYRGCGYRSMESQEHESRISNGHTAELGEFPWMIAIFLRLANRTDQYQYHGGGSLIHPSVVLTAAHFLTNKQSNELIVRAGEWNLLNDDETHAHQDREIMEIIVHSEFYASTLINDIAMMIVTEPFQLAINVNPICLPPQNVEPVDVQCTASGWGKNFYGRGSRYQRTLKKIDLPIVARHRCQMMLRRTRLGRFFRLHRSFICAGGEIGKDTCKGDGGSPLVCRIPNSPDRFYQSGIVAGGIGCASSVPGIYVNVATFHSWILEQLHYININIDSEDDFGINEFYDESDFILKR